MIDYSGDIDPGIGSQHYWSHVNIVTQLRLLLFKDILFLMLWTPSSSMLYLRGMLSDEFVGLCISYQRMRFGLLRLDQA